MQFVDTTVNTETQQSDYLDKMDQKNADILLATTNIAEQIDEEELNEIGEYVVEMYHEDLESRSEWEDSNEKWLKLANQLIEKKNFPWKNASNVKYPLLSVAALQFHARAFSALIPNENVVKTRVLGADPTTEKHAVADRVSKHMSYQVLYEMEDWQDEFDRALYILPIVGLFYKKSYYSPTNGTNVSEVILPDDLVINYYAPNFERAIKTHRIYQDVNEVIELMNLGHYAKMDLPAPTNSKHEGTEDQITGLTPPQRSENSGVSWGDDESGESSDVPYTILEAHTWWDLDEDGYKEPYIITVEEESKKVLRVVARYRTADIDYQDDGTIARIKPTEYFTRFGFLPNPESKIYYQGFGQLLGPMNAAINTILNQLIDAGTLANMPGGFLGRGMKLRGGELKFNPGEWKQVPLQGDDIRKSIFPLPYKEPSSVLYQLLGLVIQSGERLSSVQDLMTGENPGQNQPYATSIMVLEQGMKVFSGIYRRIYRALGSEFKKLYYLNYLFLDETKYFQLMDDPALQQAQGSDYSYDKMDVVPGADPNIISEAHKIAKANSLLQKKAAGLPINTMELAKRVLEAENQDNIPALLQPDPQAGPPPEIQVKMAQIQSDEKISMAKLQLEAATQEMASFKDYATAVSLLAKAQLMGDQNQREEMAQYLEAVKMKHQQVMDHIGVIKDLAAQEQQARQAEQQQQQQSQDQQSQ